MSWNYSGDPSSSIKDRIRFEIQDTDSTSPLLQDEEINFAVTDEAGADPSAYTMAGLFGAAARCLEVLARRFAAQADTVVGDLETTYSKQAQNYAERAQELRKKSQGSHAPYAGGLSWAEKAAAASDPDRVLPAFQRGQFRNPFQGPSTGYLGAGGPLFSDDSD